MKLEKVLEEIPTKVFTKEFFESLVLKVDKYFPTEEEIKKEELKKMELTGIIAKPMD